MKTTTVIIKYADCTLQVTGTYTSGRLGTMEEPPENPEFEVTKIDLIDGSLMDLIDQAAYDGRRNSGVVELIAELALFAYERQLSDLQQWIEK